MLLTIIRYSTLFLTLLNLPGFVLVYYNPVFSSFLSYLSFGLLLVYFFLRKEWHFNQWMICLGITFYSIAILSDLHYVTGEIFEIINIIKYFIYVIGGYVMVRDTNSKELTLFLILGSLSVFVQIFLMEIPREHGGRYSGFYINPNSLGFICMMGYALSFANKGILRIFAQVVFTLGGFLTFSRTFLVVWVLLNLSSVFISVKNLKVIAIAIGLFLGLLIFNEFLPKKNVRLVAMTNLITGKSSNTSSLQNDSRDKTWSLFYNDILDSPVFGNGLASFGGDTPGVAGNIGPHNAYLKIMGEGGIVPLCILLGMFGLMFYRSFSFFATAPYLLLSAIALFLFMATNHAFMKSGYQLILCLWIYGQLECLIQKGLDEPAAIRPVE